MKVWEQQDCLIPAGPFQGRTRIAAELSGMLEQAFSGPPAASWIRSLSHPLYELKPSTFWFLPPVSDCEISIIHWHPHFPSFSWLTVTVHPHFGRWNATFPIFSPWKSTTLGPQPPCAPSLWAGARCPRSPPWPGRTEPTVRHRRPPEVSLMVSGWVLDGVGWGFHQE